MTEEQKPKRTLNRPHYKELWEIAEKEIAILRQIIERYKRNEAKWWRFWK